MTQATATELRQAIDELFVAGFKQVMLIASRLAVASAISLGLLVEGKQSVIPANAARPALEPDSSADHPAPTAS